MYNLISVIIPVYNAESYIKRCVQSILEQSYRNFEVIIINDGSTDQSVEIIKQLQKQDNRIILVDQENRGVSVARNIGIEKIKGDYVTFVDADDYLRKDALEVALKYLIENEADAVTYGWYITDTNGNVKERYDSFNSLENQEDILKLILSNYSRAGGGYPWNKLWKISSFNNKYIPRFDGSLFYFEDLEWVVRMILSIKKYVVCPECLYYYSILGDSITNSTSAEKKEIGYHTAILTILQDLEKNKELQSWLKDKYYPEIVNGVIDSIKKHRKDLKKFLLRIHEQIDGVILTSTNIKTNIKIRCVIIKILNSLHLI